MGEDRPRSDFPAERSLVPDEGELVRAVVDRLPGGRALDVGTGEGRNARLLASRGWTVDAVDLSRAMLTRARERTRAESGAINWILADVDSYCVPESTYDVVTVSFLDVRNRLRALGDALTPGGVLVYEHYLQSASDSNGPGDRYRFEPNELLDACPPLTVTYYAEDPERSLVWLVARNDAV